MTGFMTSPRNSPGTVAVLDRAPTSTTFSRVLGIATLVGIGWLVVFGLFLSPNDRVQKTGVRIMYIHVPSAWLAYLAFGVTGVSSLAYLWKRTRSLAWDRVAGASAVVEHGLGVQALDELADLLGVAEQAQAAELHAGVGHLAVHLQERLHLTLR